MVKKQDFGDLDSQVAYIYTISNFKGESVKISSLGATIVSLNVMDKDSNLRDVALGYDEPQHYLENEGYLGASIGRYANRIGHGKFYLKGVEYRLEKNNGANHLHGGMEGFDKKNWFYTDETENSVTFSYYSANGEEGYPGNLKVKATFTFDDNSVLTILYEAKTDADTIVNLTNHCYFNLNGSGDILSHELFINADKLTLTDSSSIPTGELLEVKNTAFDFLKLKPVGQDINECDDQLIWAEGYDHNYILNSNDEIAATLYSCESGIGFNLYTQKPGVQLYTGNFLQTQNGKDNRVYSKHEGLCLETQFFPDSINKENFISPILRVGEKYKYETRFEFFVKK